MYGMLHASMLSEIVAQRERDISRDRMRALARERRSAARLERQVVRARAKADSASAKLAESDQRIIDLRGLLTSTAHGHAPLPW